MKKKGISQHSENVGNSKWTKLDMEGPEMCSFCTEEGEAISHTLGG